MTWSRTSASREDPGIRPGETKLHLKEFLEDMPGAPKDIVVETADAMTDAQVAAHVARHFGVRPPRLMSRR
jgi:hypothetical protein